MPAMVELDGTAWSTVSGSSGRLQGGSTKTLLVGTVPNREHTSRAPSGEQRARAARLLVLATRAWLGKARPMALASTPHRHRNVRWQLLGSVLLVAACGGKSASESRGGTGGSSTTDATGGSTTTAGGTGNATSAGGDTSTGGSSLAGTGGSENGSGTGGTSTCNGVVCEPIPNTCKQIVQEPGACCPVCLDTGCDACPDLACDTGTHAEMTAGECCPTCQPDPPDPCTQGRADYVNLRSALIAKYGSGGCMNSADCAIAAERNACMSTCGVPLPLSMVNNFEQNTMNAASHCSTCPPLPALDCSLELPACVNGQCVTEAPSD
jgi:hypothetical protein